MSLVNKFIEEKKFLEKVSVFLIPCLANITNKFIQLLCQHNEQIYSAFPILHRPKPKKS